MALEYSLLISRDAVSTALHLSLRPLRKADAPWDAGSYTKREFAPRHYWQRSLLL